MKCRLIRTTGARDANDALALRGIAFVDNIINSVFSVRLEAVLPVHDHARLSVESRLLEEVRAFLAGEKEVDLFEMMLGRRGRKCTRR